MSAQNDIIAKYGEPSKTYFDKYCVMWEIQQDFPWFPAKRIYINTDFKLQLSQAFKGLEATALQHEIITFDGCYVERKVRGSTKMSLHSWAMAIDLNASREKLGQVETHFTPEFIAIMVKYVFWGGNYKGRKDPMHFSLFNG
jgi:hypothetical protein